MDDVRPPSPSPSSPRQLLQQLLPRPLRLGAIKRFWVTTFGSDADDSRVVVVESDVVPPSPPPTPPLLFGIQPRGSDEGGGPEPDGTTTRPPSKAREPSATVLRGIDVLAVVVAPVGGRHITLPRVARPTAPSRCRRLDGTDTSDEDAGCSGVVETPSIVIVLRTGTDTTTAFLTECEADAATLAAVLLGAPPAQPPLRQWRLSGAGRISVITSTQKTAVVHLVLPVPVPPPPPFVAHGRRGTLPAGARHVMWAADAVAAIDTTLVSAAPSMARVHVVLTLRARDGGGTGETLVLPLPCWRDARSVTLFAAAAMAGSVATTPPDDDTGSDADLTHVQADAPSVIGVHPTLFTGRRAPVVRPLAPVSHPSTPQRQPPPPPLPSPDDEPGVIVAEADAPGA